MFMGERIHGRNDWGASHFPENDGTRRLAMNREMDGRSAAIPTLIVSIQSDLQIQEQVELVALRRVASRSATRVKQLRGSVSPAEGGQNGRSTTFSTTPRQRCKKLNAESLLLPTPFLTSCSRVLTLGSKHERRAVSEVELDGSVPPPSVRPLRTGRCGCQLRSRS